MTDIKISALTDAGTIQPTDEIPVVRAGTTERAEVGTAAEKTVSDNTKAEVASVSGSTVAGHAAVFADTAGTVEDGGALGALAAKSSVNLGSSDVSGNLPYADIQQVSAGVLLGNPGSSAAPVSEVALGYGKAFSIGKIVDVFEFNDFVAPSYADSIAALQTFLLKCSQKAYAYGANSESDQGPRVRVKAKCGGRQPISVSSPIIVPRYVDFDFPVELLRRGTAGAITSFYTGDTSSQALANLYQPTLIVTPGAHVTEALINANSNGTDYGAGMFSGKAWLMNGGSVGSAGANYQVGDVVYCAQPDLSPYYAPSFTVATVNGSGGVTGLTLTGYGAYSLPPVLQVQQWTTANGFTVLDANGNFLTTGGNGTGLTINAAWMPDWNNGNSRYTADFYALQTDTQIDRVLIQNCGSTTSNTYGPIRAAVVTCLNHYIGSIETGGGAQGIVLYGTDIMASRLYSTNAGTSFVKQVGSNVHCPQMILDTPVNQHFAFDHFSGCRLDLQCFSNGQRGITGAYAGTIGANSDANDMVINSRINVQLMDAGASGGIPAVFADYCTGIDLNVHASNRGADGNAAAYPLSSLIVFGSHNGVGNTLRGSVDGMSGSIYSGQAANWGIDVRDDSAGGWLKDGGVYELMGSGVPTSGSGGTGAGKAGPGSLYTDTAGGLVYRNAGTAASPSWVQLGVTGGLKFQGLWNANTNTPTLASGTAPAAGAGAVYKVSVTGATTLDGISQWNAGDELYFDGTVWEKLDGVSSEVLSVAGRTGNVTLSTGDISGLGTAAGHAATDSQAAGSIAGLPAFAASGASHAAGLVPDPGATAGTLRWLREDGWNKLPLALLPSGAKINGIGDSITAQSVYQPVNVATLVNIPTWTPNTPIPANSYYQNGNNIYLTVGGGTSGNAGGPSGINPATDGNVTWYYSSPNTQKSATSFLHWIEAMSLGRLVWDMSAGYAGVGLGLSKIIVGNGGSNYTSGDLLVLSGGAVATLNIVGGVILSATVVQPGYQPSNSYSITNSTGGASTGSGAQLTLVLEGSGTFAVNGGKTYDMVNFLPDALASDIDIFTVMGGHNDIAQINSWSQVATIFNQITSNLKKVCETLIANGRGVILFTVIPGVNFTAPGLACYYRVNRWIKAFARKETIANPNKVNVLLADAAGIMTDGSSSNSTPNNPIGGSGGVAYAMMQDGTHPSPRGAQYLALAALDVLLPLISPYTPRSYSEQDGADATYNPGGNMVEGLPWTSVANYTVGQICSNSSNIYICSQAGISAGSGGPSGTGTGIVDNSAKWNYVRPQGMSLFNAGQTGTNPTGLTGMTFTGLPPTRNTILRMQGSASGTITQAIESPWSNGQKGQRYSASFSLGSGTTGEIWENLIHNEAYGNFGILAGDLGVTPFFAEVEIELSNVANLYAVWLGLLDTSGSFNAYAGNTSSAEGYQMIASSGEMRALPNGGKFVLRTQPMALPLNVQNVGIAIRWGFDASGGAGSATCITKINNYKLGRAGAI